MRRVSLQFGSFLKEVMASPFFAVKHRSFPFSISKFYFLPDALFLENSLPLVKDGPMSEL